MMDDGIAKEIGNAFGQSIFEVRWPDHVQQFVAWILARRHMVKPARGCRDGTKFRLRETNTAPARFSLERASTA
jgi:hypothetical protein